MHQHGILVLDASTLQKETRAFGDVDTKATELLTQLKGNCGIGNTEKAPGFQHQEIPVPR